MVRLFFRSLNFAGLLSASEKDGVSMYISFVTSSKEDISFFDRQPQRTPNGHAFSRTSHGYCENLAHKLAQRELWYVHYVLSHKSDMLLKRIDIF